MHVRTLGRAELSANGTRLGPEAKVAFPLLLHLVLERDHWVSRVQLQEMLFPEQDREHARHSLRQSVYTLRKEGFPIEGSGPAIHIPAKSIVDDYSTLLTPQLEGERELAELMGGWLAGFEPTISKAYSHWFEGKRGEVALGMRSTLLAELAVHKRNACWGQCERTCRAILTLDPLNEEATLGLAEALALTGAKVQAIRILERYQEEMPNADLRLPAKILRRRISERLAVNAGERRPVFVGRSAEMQAVSEAIDGARERRPTGILISGEPGIGKTRLLREAESFAVLAGFRSVSHVCHPHDAARPLGVIMGLVPGLRQLPGSIGCAPDALALVNRLGTVPQQSPIHEVLAVDSQDVAALMGWAVLELVSAVLVETPLVILVDDVQWADDASLTILTRLLESGTGPLFVLSAGRHNPRPMMGALGRNFRPLQLRPLAQADARSLLVSEFNSSDQSDSADALSWAETNAGGNPLFIVSLARHASAHPESLTLPRELARLLEDRLRDLAPNASITLAAICALGRHASFRHLEQVLSLPRHELLVALDLLDRQGFAAASGEVLSATHPLIAEASLQSASESFRKYLFHTSAAVLQEEAVRSEDPAILWDVISLAKRSGASQGVIGIARQCAKHALAIGRAADACAILLDACNCAAPPETLQSLHEDLLFAAVSAGRWRLVSECAERLRAFSGLSRLTRSQLNWLSTEAEWHRGHPHQELTRRLQQHLSDPDIPIQARLRIADLLCIGASNTGDAAVAKEASAFASKYLETSPSTPEALGILLVSEATFGGMARAQQHARAILEATEGILPTQISLRLRNNAAICLRFAGDPEASCNHLERAHRDAIRYGFDPSGYCFSHEIAFANLTRGNLELAATWIAEAERLLEATQGDVDPYGLIEAKVIYSLLSNDSIAATAHASELRKLSSSRSARIQAFSEAVSCLAGVMAGGPVPAAVVSQLVDDFRSARVILEVDFFAWVMHRLLEASGATAVATELVEEYVTIYRRDLSPLPPFLCAVLSTHRPVVESTQLEVTRSGPGVPGPLLPEPSDRCTD